MSAMWFSTPMPPQPTASACSRTSGRWKAPFAPGCSTNTRHEALLRRDAGVLDDAAPSLGLALEQGFECCRRRLLRLDRRHAEFGKAVDQGRILKRLLQRV